MLTLYNLNWGVITGISSVVIALSALFFSIWQGIQARRHNRISFRPHLSSSDTSDANKGIYIVELTNNGLGPAIIKDFIINVDGKRISGDGAKSIEKALKILFPNMHYRSQQSGLGEGYVMAANEKCHILAIQFAGPQIPTEEFVEHAFGRTAIEIPYKSFYNENFHFSSSGEKPGKRIQPEK